jgi:hypothetical protein
MTSAQRLYRARVFAEVNRVNRRSRPLAGLSSIVWGTRGLRGLGVTLPDGTTTDRNTPAPFPGNPDTQPGAWPGLTFTPSPWISGGCIFDTTTGKSVCTQLAPLPNPASGSPGTVPVVVTPTSGPIPSPGTVAAGTTPPTAWLEQQMITGIPNSYLLLGALGAFFFFGGKRK